MRSNLIFILIFILSISCEEPIKLDLPSGEPFTIIDANISESNIISRVILSKSLGFNDTIDFPAIENASVVVSHELNDATFSFNYSTSLSIGAVYEPQTQLKLTAGDNYLFSVYLPGSIEDPDTLYQASMKMPHTVLIDSIRFKESTQESTQESNSYTLRIYFTDPENTRNFYSWRVSQKINGNFVLLTSTKVPLYTDQGIDGKAVYVEYSNKNFLTNDTIQVHFKSITRDTYDYYRSLNNLIDVTGTSVSSDNPRSNFLSTAGDQAFGFYSLEGIDDSQIIAIIDSLE